MHTAAHALTPGGRLLLIDGHPAMFSLDDRGGSGPLIVRNLYDSAEPIVERARGKGSYAAPQAQLEATCTVNFAHGLSAILNAAIRSGLVLREFEELDRIPWDAQLPRLAKVDDHYWALPKDMPFFPLAFALTACRGEKPIPMR